MTKQNKKKLTKKIEILKRLAERGVGGEKENAVRLLSQFKEKVKKLNNNPKRKKTFKMADMVDCKTIMVHCIYDTISEVEITEDLRKKELYVKISNEEYETIVNKFNKYYNDFIIQKQAFVMGYLLKNQLGVNANNEDKDENINQEFVESIVDKMQTIKAQPRDCALIDN